MLTIVGLFGMPLFLWSLYSTAIIQILATPVLGITLVLLSRLKRTPMRNTPSALKSMRRNSCRNLRAITRSTTSSVCPKSKARRSTSR